MCGINRKFIKAVKLKVYRLGYNNVKLKINEKNKVKNNSAERNHFFLEQ